MINFVEKLMTKVGEDITPDTDLGIKWAHSALGTRPLDNAARRSIVIKFLKFTTKEKVIHTAWKKPITFEDKGCLLTTIMQLKCCPNERNAH